MYEIFARSSSASFERQASCDSSPYPHNNTNNMSPQQQSIHAANKSNKPTMSNLKTNSIIVPSTSSLASSIISAGYFGNSNSAAMSQPQYHHQPSSRLVTPFKPPALFSLIATTAAATGKTKSLNIVVNPIIQYGNYQTSSLCSTSGVSTMKSGRSGASSTNNLKNLFAMNRQSSVTNSSAAARANASQPWVTHLTEKIQNNKKTFHLHFRFRKRE